jgi:hypothetical protein
MKLVSHEDRNSSGEENKNGQVNTKSKVEIWVHRLEIDNLKEEKIPFEIIRRSGWDSFLIKINTPYPPLDQTQCEMKQDIDGFLEYKELVAEFGESSMEYFEKVVDINARLRNVKLKLLEMSEIYDKDNKGLMTILLAKESDELAKKWDDTGDEWTIWAFIPDEVFDRRDPREILKYVEPEFTWLSKEVRM